MPCPPTQPPWEFLLSASRNSLQSYELSRLSHAANLRKEIGALIDQWIEESACAMLARLLMDHPDRLRCVQESAQVAESFMARPQSVSDNVFANRPAPSADVRGAA
ncbi:MAG TPA: hypothetical protein VI431_08765 [Candidatus Acidoferrum sp.]